ncbi:MAG TPA: protease pro-enzyme activation domain-containing protein, partial [Verrucomicrobiae bacterium]|nr:protease pro-enzyme activation domain-containing protein [Verrucomicrobiae bacterium]
MMLPLASICPAQAADTVRLAGHVPHQLAKSRLTGHVQSNQIINLALTLPIRNQAGLSLLLQRIYNKKDPLYHHFITAPTFAANYGPTESDYAAVAAFATS